MENNKTERISKAAAEYQRRQKKNKTIRTTAIVAAIIIVIGLVILAFFTSGTWARTRTVMTVGDEKVSCAEFNYYFQTTVNSTYQEFYNTYGDSASIFLDLSKPLDEQEFSEGVTWEDQLKELTTQSVQEVYALFNEASEAGFTLSDEEIANVTVSNAYMEETAKQYGLTAAQYLKAVYGKGMSLKLYAECLLKAATASGYYNAKSLDYTYSADEISSYYNENPDDFDTMNLRIFAIAGTEEDGNRDAAEAQANEILGQITDEQSFAQLAYQYALDTDKDAYADENSTYHAGVKASDMTCEGMAEWFYDDARVEGDTNVFSDEGGYYVAMYLGREDNNYNELTLRHILVPFATDEEGNVTADANENAKALIEQYFEEFESGDKSEDSFAELAKKYSSDSTASEGGFIDGIVKGNLETSFDEWMFAEGRQVGDYDMLETSYGWHMIYYCGESDVNYRDALVEEAMKTNDINSWYESVMADYEVKIVEPVYNSNMVG